MRRRSDRHRQNPADLLLVDVTPGQEQRPDCFDPRRLPRPGLALGQLARAGRCGREVRSNRLRRLSAQCVVEGLARAAERLALRCDGLEREGMRRHGQARQRGHQARQRCVARRLAAPRPASRCNEPMDTTLAAMTHAATAAARTSSRKTLTKQTSSLFLGRRMRSTRLPSAGAANTVSLCSQRGDAPWTYSSTVRFSYSASALSAA